ncbi:50S ribosome-binding GTPase [Scandinavium goeteborgense]|uniref:GTPase family protein n=1 Tax=Scandinavium goeteborgense TaxID=1851514 RepID=UPI00216693D2|nr:GTPase [Scandinavium goeteborgense]MCS2153249.1 50S ribosome-binding GTPase [Scandinavium goeteborgense]
MKSPPDKKRANDSKGDKLIRDVLDIFPEKIRRTLFEKIKETIDYEPSIGVMGKSGAGKSSLCNAIFKGEVCAVSDVEACTREVQRLKIQFGNRTLEIVDIPGVGENAERDEEYRELYEELMSELDLILWVIKGDDRAFTSDEDFYKNVLIPAGGDEKVIFVLNQVDKVEPFREWDTSKHHPSLAQLANIRRKEDYVAERFEFPHHPIISVSADEGYNIVKLVEAMIRALPDRAKSGTASQLKDEFKTDDVKLDAKDGFGNIVSDLVDTAIDVLPVPESAKSLLRKGKDFVVESAKKIWDYFF